MSGLVHVSLLFVFGTLHGVVGGGKEGAQLVQASLLSRSCGRKLRFGQSLSSLHDSTANGLDISSYQHHLLVSN